MSRIIRSALFKRQLIDIASSDRLRAGSDIALKFVDQIEESIRFIAIKPLACAVHTRLGAGRWPLGFPELVALRVTPTAAAGSHDTAAQDRMRHIVMPDWISWQGAQGRGRDCYIFAVQ